MPRKPKSKHDNEPCAAEKIQAAEEASSSPPTAAESSAAPAGTTPSVTTTSADVGDTSPVDNEEDDDSEDGGAEEASGEVKKKKRRRGKKKKKGTGDVDASVPEPAKGATADTGVTKYNFDKDFWDMKYATTPEAQEWLLSFADIAKFFKATVKDTATKILIVGCGDAPFSADLYAAGYHNITNCDNSSVCIEKMKKRHPEMTWLVADAAAMDCIDDESFGVVIEKSLIDTFYAAPDIDTDSTITNMWAEVWRVVEPGGLYFSLNFIMDTIEKGMTQRLLSNWSDQIGAAMGRAPWKSIVPVQARASNVPAKAQKHPALLLCTKPADLSIKQFS